MPFDMHPVDPDIDQLARMELLGKIAAQKPLGSQGSFFTCLWSSVRQNRKAHALVKDIDEGRGNGPTCVISAAMAFGFRECDARFIWGDGDIAEKRNYIDSRIAMKRASVEWKMEQLNVPREAAEALVRAARYPEGPAVGPTETSVHALTGNSGPAAGEDPRPGLLARLVGRTGPSHRASSISLDRIGRVMETA